jgi:predicted nicotinamide N-methyase
MKDKWTREKLSELASGFMRPRIFITAAQLDLFTKLARKPATAKWLSEEHGLDLRGLTIVLDALAAMELVIKDSDGVYNVDPEVAMALSSDSGVSILPMILHRGRMWDSWSHLTEIVESGRSSVESDFKERTDQEMEAFIAAMHVAGSKMARDVAEQVDATRFTRMLDAGGGSGIYSIEFMKKNPQLKVALFDLPRVTQIAERNFKEAGMLHRAELVAGDFREDGFPNGFDLVLLSAIIHMNSREMNRLLYKKALDSLEGGGSLVIRDFVMNETRTKPVMGAIFAVNMLAATKEGNCYTEAEVEEDLRASGFSEIRILNRGAQFMDHIIEAVK